MDAGYRDLVTALTMTSGFLLINSTCRYFVFVIVLLGLRNSSGLVKPFAPMAWLPMTSKINDLRFMLLLATWCVRAMNVLGSWRRRMRSPPAAIVTRHSSPQVAIHNPHPPIWLWSLSYTQTVDHIRITFGHSTEDWAYVPRGDAALAGWLVKGGGDGTADGNVVMLSTYLLWLGFAMPAMAMGDGDGDWWWAIILAGNECLSRWRYLTLWEILAVW